MADLAKAMEDPLDVSEAVDNKPDGSEDGTSVDGGTPVSNGPSKDDTNLDLLLGAGGDGFDSNPVTQPGGDGFDSNTVTQPNNTDQPLVDFLSGPNTQTDQESSSQPLLDLSQPGSDPSAQVQDPFSQPATEQGNQDSGSNLLVDVAPGIDSTADGEINLQQDLGIQPTTDPETQPTTDLGSNPGVEVKVDIDITPEINASQDLPANNQESKGKDSLTISSTSEGGRLGSTSSGGAPQDDPFSASGGSDNETKENKSPPSKYRAQPVLDASKEKDKQRHPRYQVQTRQQRIDEITQKNQQRRAAVEERKKKQQQEDKERKEALARRSRERTENAKDKRRSWSAFGPRDAPSPALSASTPRGRSAERMADRTDRPTRPASASSSLGVNKRLSSSMSTVYRPVHLVRLGPNADDWFEVHLPPPQARDPDRRSSSPGTDKRPPRHHQSSPNLASNVAKRRMKALYQPRDIKSAQSTPTHTPRPLSAQRTSSNSRLSPAKTTDDIKKNEKKAATPRSTRPPSPRQRPASPATSTGRTTRVDATDSGKKTPGRSPSPRTYGRQSDGDVKKPRTPGSRLSTQSQPPPIKKALTPTAAVSKATTNSPSRTSLRSSKNSSSPTTAKPSTPRRDPTTAKKEPITAKKDAALAKKESASAKKEAAPAKKEAAPAKKEVAPIKKTPAPVKKEAPVNTEPTEPSPKEEPIEPVQPLVDLDYKHQEKSVNIDDVILEESSGGPSEDEGGDVVETKMEEEEATPDKPTEAAAQEAAIPVAVEAAIPVAVEAPSPDKELPQEGEVKEPDVSNKSEPKPQVNGTTPAEEKPKDMKDMTEEERAKAVLAERRRQAREKAEREAELEKQRQEQLQREEEERVRREEEERIRQEEEDMRLAEEHRKAEEERLQKAIEENQKREEEEKIRKEEEAKQKEEEEKKRQEEITKRDEEIQEKLKKEEEERDARKKRVEEIMKRARRGAQAAGQDGSEGTTPPDESVSDEPEPKTNGLSSSSILNNEKYRNLLINRSRLSGEEDNDEDEEREGSDEEATTNGKMMQNDADMADGDVKDEVEDILTTNQEEPSDVDSNKDISEPLVPNDDDEDQSPSSEIYQSSSKVVRPLDEDLSSSATSTPSPSSTSSPSSSAPRVDNVNAYDARDEDGGDDNGLNDVDCNVGLDIGMKNANNDQLNANLMHTMGAGSVTSQEGAENAPGVNLSFSLDAGTVQQQQATTLPDELAADAV